MVNYTVNSSTAVRNVIRRVCFDDKSSSTRCHYMYAVRNTKNVYLEDLWEKFTLRNFRPKYCCLQKHHKVMQLINDFNIFKIWYFKSAFSYNRALACFVFHQHSLEWDVALEVKTSNPAI